MINVNGFRTVGLMPKAKPPMCRLHGDRMDPHSLVGRELRSVVASWYFHPGDPVIGPVAVWLIDERGASTHITISEDWCLLVEEAEPITGFDMGEYGRFEIGPDVDATPFAPHFGSRILAVREDYHEITGRVALELVFPAGGVRCDGWGGDLRLTTVTLNGQA